MPVVCSSKALFRAVQVFDVRFDPAAFASLPTREVGPFVVVAVDRR